MEYCNRLFIDILIIVSIFCWGLGRFIRDMVKVVRSFNRLRDILRGQTNREVNTKLTYCANKYLLDCGG